MDLELVDYDIQTLEKSFEWLNDPEMKLLTETPDINKEAQLAWFKNLPNRSNYIVKSITADTIPIGVSGLKNINKTTKDAEFFGYIGDKNFWGKGIGKWMLNEIELLARLNGLTRIYLNVLFVNFRAVNLYFNQGYKIYKVTHNSYLMEKFL
jgi:RimJ/RimL family protein N-acetyltransferase